MMTESFVLWMQLYHMIIRYFWSLDYIYRKMIHGILQVSQLVPGRSTLFVSYCKPHAQVTSKTLSRWVVTLLSAAGVDTSVFKAHASRSAASCFHAKKLSSIDIIKLGDWSASTNVFRKFYERYF